MKKIRHILSVVLFVTGALLISCTKADTTPEDNPGSSTEPQTIQFTATLAPKNGSPVTKAITTGKDEGGKEILNVKWKAGEKIFIYYETTDGHASTTANVESVDGDTGVATITAAFAANAKDNGEVKFVYPSSLATADGELDESILLNKQNGLLRTGTTNISNNFDAATKTGKISVSGGTASVKGTLAMENRVCICRIALTLDNGTGTSIDTDEAGTTLYIAVGDEYTYTISSPFEASLQQTGQPTAYRGFKTGDVIYVAMLPVESKDIFFFSINVDGLPYGISTTGTLTAGKFYRNISLTLTKNGVTGIPNFKDISEDSIIAADGDIIYQSSSAVTSHTITIPDGATVMLAGVNIGSSVICSGNANIILAGTNTVSASTPYPGIQAGGSGTTLTISGSGSLTTTCGNYGAGIGSGLEGTCGNISIRGGTVTATGGTFSAGIGGGASGTCGNITISGGTVIASGGICCAGIGGGISGTCGNITISGGNVTATKGGTATYSIGFNADSDPSSSSCGTVTIGGTMYYDGATFINGGETYLATSPFIWPAP